MCGKQVVLCPLQAILESSLCPLTVAPGASFGTVTCNRRASSEPFGRGHGLETAAALASRARGSKS